MVTRKELTALEELEASGNLNEAFLMTLYLLEKYDGDATGQVFATLERCAQHFPEAAVAAATSYMLFDRREATPGTIIKLFELAITGDSDRVRAMATFGLGQHLLHIGKEIGRGIKLMKTSHRLGYPKAAAELGVYYEHGRYGLPNDIKKAISLYVKATEGGNAEGMYRLASYMLDHAVTVGDYHPLKLLKQAALLGCTEAAEMMMKLVEMGADAEETEINEILPYVIVPDGLTRMELVRAAMTNELTVSTEQAADCVAALMGYPSWKTMEQAANSGQASGKFDEECSAAEFNKRENRQIDIFAARMNLDRVASAAAIKLLRPSSRIVQPSLRRLEEIIDSPPNLEMAISDFLELLRPTSNQHDNRRISLVWPLQVKRWLDLLEDLGWELHHRRDEALDDGSQVSSAKTADGRIFKIFMTDKPYDPGDLGDTNVEDLMRTISTHCAHAILIFNHPRISTIPRSEDSAALYGGKILNNGDWADFLLRKADGIEDALRQQHERLNILSPNEVAKYAFDGAIDIACRLSGWVLHQETSTRYALFRGASNWSSPLPEIAIETMELMREIGQHLGRD